MSMHRARSALAQALWASLFVASCVELDDGADAPVLVPGVPFDAASSGSPSTAAQLDAMSPGMVRDSGPLRDASAPSDGGGVRTNPDAASDAATDAGAGIPSTCTQADINSCNNQTGSHCGYTFEYWKDQGTGCLTSTRTGFQVEWSNINNLLGRKGLRPGSKTQMVSYSADYQPNGNSYLCVYGWTKNPLVEYYIVDSWGSWRPPGGEGRMGTVTSDDGTYDIYRTQRVNQPSIEGTSTFYQYWSVRTQKRTNGTITVANHFNMWQQLGMNMGNLYEVSMTVEGYQSSGKAKVDFSMK